MTDRPDRLDNIVDKLIEGMRMLGESRMIRADDPKRVTEEQAVQVADGVRSFLAKYNLPHSHVARGIGMSAATISQLMNGHYVGRWQQLAIDLDVWLEGELKRVVTQQPGLFVKTSVAREMMLCAELAMEAGGVGMVFGDSGLGKTMALKAIAAEKRGSVYISCETVGTTSQAILEAIGNAMRITPGLKCSGRYWLEAIADTLQGTSRMLIVDQIHRLCGVDRNDKALYTLVDIFDRAGSPQLWCGTIDLVEYLERGEARGKEPLAQIRSRIVIARNLHDRAQRDDGAGEPLFTIEDIRKIFGKGKLKLTRDGERFLMEMANLPGSGGLRTCANIVRIATKLNEEDTSVTLTEALLREVSGLLATRRAMQRTADRLEDERRASASVAMAG